MKRVAGRGRGRGKGGLDNTRIPPYPHIALNPHTHNPGHHSHVYPLNSNTTWTSIAILARAKIVQAIRASKMSSSHDHHAGATPPRPSQTLWRRRLVSQQDSPAGEPAPRGTVAFQLWGQRVSSRARSRSRDIGDSPPPLRYIDDRPPRTPATMKSEQDLDPSPPRPTRRYMDKSPHTENRRRYMKSTPVDLETSPLEEARQGMDTTVDHLGATSSKADLETGCYLDADTSISRSASPIRLSKKKKKPQRQRKLDQKKRDFELVRMISNDANVWWHVDPRLMDHLI